MDGINAENSFNSNKKEFKKTIPNPETTSDTGERQATDKQVAFLKKLVMQKPDHEVSQDPKVIDGLAKGNLPFELAKVSIDQLLNT